jgi:aspartate-semialdehyde dehydrogenase
LAPLHEKYKMKRLIISTYQSVSGTGVKAVQQLDNEEAGIEGEMAYPHPIGRNALPHCDVFLENGYTKEEMKIVWETRKILGNDEILVNPTCVRVPVFYGHSEAVHIETRAKISAAQVRKLLAKAPGIKLLDKRADGGYPTPVTEAANSDLVFVGRIREDISHPRGIDLWVVADNVRKGAALNSVQIAEILVKSYL